MYTFSYNGIDLDPKSIRTIRFLQTPEWSPDNMDYVATRFEVTVQALLNADLLPANPEEPPAATEARIRKCLKTPRAALLIEDIDPLGSGPQILVQSPPVRNAVQADQDAKNGPQPGALSIIQLTPTTYIIEFTIVTWLYECCGGGGTPNAYISHRWTDSVSIDQHFYTKYTRRGRMIFRGDLLSNFGPQQGADLYRNKITASCPLKQGFLRTRSEYTIQSDGLALDYVIEDTEQFALPLPPETKFEGEYTVTTTAGAVFQEEMVVRAWGPKNAAKADLFSAAITCMLARLADGKANVKLAGKSIKNGYLRDRLHENYVEIRLGLFTAKQNPTWKLMTFPAQNFSVGQSNQVPDPGERGTAGLWIAAQILQDPCLSQTASLGVQPRVNSLGTPEDGSKVLPPPVVTLPTGGGLLAFPPATVTEVKQLTTDTYGDFDTNDFADGIYTDYIMDVEYTQDMHTLQLPVASSAVTASSFAVVANPTMRKTVAWQAEKLNACPTMPDPNSADPNEVLLYTALGGRSQDYEADSQTIIWRCHGTYLYGIVDPTLASLALGTVPYTQIPYSATTMPATKFEKGLTSKGQTSNLQGTITRVN